MRTVLVVDDDASVRRLVATVLDRAGYRVVEAEGGVAAESWASRQSEPLVLLITDLVMPGMSGESLAERLRRAQPDMRVIYMSGYSEEDLERRGIRAVGGAYLTKPFTSDVLSMVVQGALAE